MFPANLGASPADVMVAVWNEDSFSDSVKLAQELRAGGLRVDLYPEADKLAKQFKYASSREVSFVVWVISYRAIRRPEAGVPVCLI